jgi:hypothetical protein
VDLLGVNRTRLVNVITVMFSGSELISRILVLSLAVLFVPELVREVK